MTEYVVLSNWEAFSSTYKASSPKSAIEQAVIDGEGIVAGKYVAVPLRSWKPVNVEPETKIKVKFS